MAESNYDDGIAALEVHVRSNEVTSDGVWFEMKNLLSEWEKMMLIFGYGGDGDFAACEEVRSFASAANPNREFRCNPVN